MCHLYWALQEIDRHTDFVHNQVETAMYPVGIFRVCRDQSQSFRNTSRKKKNDSKQNCVCAASQSLIVIVRTG